ncbi:MAG: 3-dehydroquinate synthase [Gemmatimonadetes bacterium]|nr:3-dehydroquinate synthase [Gemmatimonadota bacterium]
MSSHPASVGIRVEPGDSATAYTVHVRAGCLDELPDMLATEIGAHRYVMISDDTVARLHGHALCDRLNQAGVRTDLLTFAAGEASKTRAIWTSITDSMLELGIGRDACVLAVGGGVAGDLAGFVAATYMRGIDVVQIPTSVLAMIDAAIGGKTGVDAPAGKNLIGAFHHPRAVIADPRVLATLPDHDYRAGLAEAVKHGAITDADYFGWLVANAALILSRDDAAVERLIRRSVEIKAAAVQRDAREHGSRAMLNFGHTVGHALERLTDWRVPHGHAVAIGMITEARAGEAMGLTERGTAAALASACTAFELPARMPVGVAPGDVLDVMMSDKKSRAGVPRFALISRIGQPLHTGHWTHEIDRGALTRALEP